MNINWKGRPLWLKGGIVADIIFLIKNSVVVSAILYMARNCPGCNIQNIWYAYPWCLPACQWFYNIKSLNIEVDFFSLLLSSPFGVVGVLSEYGLFFFLMASAISLFVYFIIGAMIGLIIQRIRK